MGTKGHQGSLEGGFAEAGRARPGRGPGLLWQLSPGWRVPGWRGGAPGKRKLARYLRGQNGNLTCQVAVGNPGESLRDMKCGLERGLLGASGLQMEEIWELFLWGQTPLPVPKGKHCF